MDRTNLPRRHFLQGAIAAPFLPATTLLPGLARAATAAQGTHALISIHLDGGCDGLSLIVPAADPVYRATRPTLALAPEAILPLAQGLGMNPLLARLHARYTRGEVAIVNGVGYPGFNRSHFAAEDIYWSATPSGPLPASGWQGRILDALGASAALSGVWLGNAVPRSLVAETLPVPAVPSVSRYTYKTPSSSSERAAQLGAMASIITQPAGSHALLDAINRQNLAAALSIETVQAAAGSWNSPVSYGSDSFSQSLKLAAQLVRADAGVRIIGTELGGFDTHAGQRTTLDRLFTTLDAGLEAFWQDAAAGGFAERVTILIWSEFGRRVAENASGGTDHGAAGPMLLLGPGVRGGLHGAHPDLNNLERGDLRMSTDFRQVYASIAESWLGAPARTVVGDGFGGLSLFL